MALTIHRTLTLLESWHLEGGLPPRNQARIAVAAAVITNPFLGDHAFVEDLAPVVDEVSPQLGSMLAAMTVSALGEPVEAYGKGALVGEQGELEHGSAIIHTLKFGNPFRDLVDGTTLLPSAEKRAGCGSTIDLAMKHVRDASVRSHHWTFELRVPDAPHADQIVIACAAASTGRPQARIGQGPQDDSV